MNIIRNNRFKNKKTEFYLFLLILSSFFLKVIVGYALKDTFFSRGNSYTPLNAIAFNLVDNFEYAIESGIPSIDYEPLYPGLLAVGYKIFGKNWFGVTIFQGVLYGFTSWLLFLIGIRLKDKLTGFIAAAYHSFYPFLFFNCLSVIDTTLFVFLAVLLLYLIIFRWNNYWRHYVLIGFAIGFFLLTRASALFMLPPLLVYLYIKSTEYSRIKLVLIVCVAALIVMSPWLMRNYNYTESLVVSCHGGFGLWQGNNEFSYDYLKSDRSLDQIYLQKSPPDIYRLYPRKVRPPLEAIRVAQLYKKEGFKYIKSNPLTFIKLAGLKFVKFWTWKYNPIKSSYSYGNKQLRKWVHLASYIPLLIALPFGLFFLARKSFLFFLLILGIILMYTCAHMIIMGYSRLRLPLDPLLMLILGITISNFYYKIKLKMLKKIRMFFRV